MLKLFQQVQITNKQTCKGASFIHVRNADTLRE